MGYPVPEKLHDSKRSVREFLAQARFFAACHLQKYTGLKTASDQ
jgi:hypothetical protein